MPDLAFDLNKSYEENIEVFKLHVAALDPAMAEILLNHLDTLLAGEDPGGRTSRTAFNRAVLVDLEAPTAYCRRGAMTRYYLGELSIEGFRGINNAGEPLKIKFTPNAVNSICAPNGIGKTSIFEAIHYAIFGVVPRLVGLQAAEQPETYINNRFLPRGASVAMTFAADDGTPDIPAPLQRSAAGIRTVNSSTAQARPEGILRSLREGFVLVDSRKLARLVDDTALVRGRSFASLV